jgi:GNAT superfamily N-acetyltransferase
VIRVATPADAPAMIDMGRALALESPKYRDMTFDEAKLMALGERINSVLMSDLACSFVAERAGQVIGMMVVGMAERFFGGDLYVTDLTLYVKPEHRGGLAFARLVQAAEAWARERGVRDACFGVSTEVHAERTVHAYQRMGYRLTGYTLTKTLAHGD